MDKVCLLDVQGFQFKSKQFLCKELAIKPLKYCCHNIKKYVFNYPIDYTNLHSSTKSQIRYLMNNIHGHFWYSDDATPNLHLYSDLGKILHDEIVNKNYKIVLIKGQHKARWLFDIINSPNIQIINLEEYNCPSLKNLKQDYFSLPCESICDMHYISGKACAVENLHLINNWLLECDVVASILHDDV